MIDYGAQRFELILQPVSGKAVPVHAGEILRITQLEGEQCVDFNAFNLHDYKERMDVGSSRGATGFRPRRGSIMLSNPPRYRPMLGVVEMPASCQTDTISRTCNSVLFESAFGLEKHTNCQDTIAESISEYGLTPDDVHDSFNIWMNSEWDSTGRKWTVENTGRAGDYVDLIALIDLLAVPVTCGSGDIRPTSNFSFKPIKIEVFQKSGATEEITRQVQEQHGSFRSQRTPDQFRVKEIKADRELHPVPGWQPNFLNYPIKTQDVDVALSSREYEVATQLTEYGYGRDVGEVIRRAFMVWYNKHRTHSRPLKLPPV